MLFTNRILHVKPLFYFCFSKLCLQEEGQDLRLNIREALLTMVDAFRPESANSTAHVPPCKAAANGSSSVPPSNVKNGGHESYVLFSNIIFT